MHSGAGTADTLLCTRLLAGIHDCIPVRHAVSAFNGPELSVRSFDSIEAEAAGVAKWISERRSEGVAPNEIGIFVRSDNEIDRARRAAQLADLPYRVLDARAEVRSDSASICTMHLAKGLEFRAVAVMACDDEILPLQSRIESISDEADLEEVYNTERHLLYVACTRARDHLLITSVEPPSEFLGDMVRRT